MLLPLFSLSFPLVLALVLALGFPSILSLSRLDTERIQELDKRNGIIISTKGQMGSFLGYGVKVYQAYYGERRKRTFSTDRSVVFEFLAIQNNDRTIAAKMPSLASDHGGSGFSIGISDGHQVSMTLSVFVRKRQDG